ncbi:uncharacterized protein TNIN_107681 [Trichonephila inaurata madagascariensis]|uniref:Uncharacterized protein n=1 Tax=Trichonephila inaurata madagascariensis TaxID=2747483 RepID=A0A8X6Y4Z7_9ARAC|nr:uncharacterized protein TNIN_107681 [Trichonephila inaurata madagascariensis]
MSHCSEYIFWLHVMRMCEIKERIEKKSLLLCPPISDAYTKDPIKIKCLKELCIWSDLRTPDATIDYSSNISTAIMKTFHNMKTLFLDEKASLVMVGKKIANFEPAHLFQKLLSNHNYVNNFSNLMEILESWCFYTPVENDLSFWEDIFVVRLCLLQCLPFCISTNFCKDKARISELKCMAQLTYNILQIQRAGMYLSQGFPEKCIELLNCIHIESKTMNNHILPLYMDSVFLQIKQRGNDVKVECILKRASIFLKSKLSQPMEKNQKCMYFIYDKVISALQEKDAVAKEVFLNPCNTSYDKSIGWIYCGKYFQKIYKPGSAKTNLVFAMQCFLRACRYINKANYGDLIPRILWILSNDDLSLKLLYTFLSDGGKEILTSCWLPWIPQLLNTFLRSKVCNLSYVLNSIGRKYPSSLYFLLNIFMEKVASRRDKQEHKKCLGEILHHMEKEHPELCFTLRNIRTEFLKLVEFVRLNVYDVLKSIESEICDILHQSIAEPSNVDVASKISQIACKKLSYFEGKVDSNIKIMLIESIELSKTRDLIGFLKKFSEWIAYYEWREKRTFPLERMSKFLSTYHLHQKKVDLFVNSYSKPSSIQISRFLPTVEIMEGGCRILIQGDNGKVYPYLISHNMGCENIFEKIDAEFASTYSLLDIYNLHCTTIEQQNLVIPGCFSLFTSLYHREEFIQNVDKSYRLELFKAVQNHMIPKNILKEVVAQSADDYIVARRTFS